MMEEKRSPKRWKVELTLRSKCKASSEKVDVEGSVVKKRNKEDELDSEKISKVYDAGLRFRR